MSTSQERINYLFQRYLAKTFSPEERQEFLALVREARHDAAIQALIEEAFHRYTPDREVPAAFSEEVFRKITAPATATPASRSPRLVSRMVWRYAAAAAALALLLGSVLLLVNRQQKKAERAAVAAKQHYPDIAPGSNKATLTLADGTTIALDSIHKGQLAQQGGVTIIQLNGQLAYKGKGSGVLYNTIRTPRGGQYQVILPDSTKVWLNAASSLKFPTAFTGTTRLVELEGEGYFEIAKNEKMPFIVAVNSMRVQALGTHFNIMAYADEKTVNTTLLEGAVLVTAGSSQQKIAPGQRTVLNTATNNLLVEQADVNEAVAWKNGYYYFNRTSVAGVMRQIARWYDVDIVYEGKVPDDEIVGKLPRTAYVSQVLHIMELIGLRFKIEGRTITVLS